MCLTAVWSSTTQVGVLNWFARLWEIDEEEYWGYITTCGTEGNLHGILVGRENFPDGVMYASSESHYSVFKAARMYRMEAEKVRVRCWRRLGVCCVRRSAAGEQAGAPLPSNVGAIRYGRHGV